MWYRNVVTAEKHTSVIAALFLPENKAKKLALKHDDLADGDKPEPVDNLHITLLYMGKANDLGDKRELIETALQNIADKHKKIKGKVGGIGCFAGDGETKPFYASYSSTDLDEIRQELVEAMEALGIELDKTHGFTPHITLAYLAGENELPQIDIPEFGVEFDQLTLAWAGEQTHYSLS